MSELADPKEARRDGLRAIDERVLRFAQAPENVALLSKTGSFCTPFRGTVFGQSTVEAIDAELATRPIAALILATNPNVSNFCDPRFGSLQDHIATGRFGETHWNSERKPQPGWQPTEEWRWKSQHYEVLRTAGLSLDTVAFANYIPWGSCGTVKSFASELDSALLRRVIDLADEIFALVLRRLRPKVVITTSSISTDLPLSCIARHRKTAFHGSCEYFTAGGSTRTLNYSVGVFQLGSLSTHIVHVPHPAAWKMSNEARDSIVRTLAAEVRALLK